MTEQQETQHILTITGGDTRQAMQMIETQLNVLHTRSQVLLSLAGIVITVTGFSGRLIAGTNLAAQGLLIAGLVTVLLSVIWSFVRVMQIRWVTMMFNGKDLEHAIHEALVWRNIKTRSYLLGGKILCIGLILYCCAIAIMLANPEPLTVPAR